MEIRIDNEFSAWLREQIMASYQGRDNVRRGDWHVSDLLFPRYAVLSRLSGGVKPSDEAVGFFLTGEAYHRAIQKILGKQNAEVKSKALGVVGTADFFDGTMLIEFKTSRKWTVPELPEDHYIDQAKIYSFIFGTPRVRIVAIYPTAGRKWDGSQSSTVEIRSWIVELSDTDKENIKQQMMILVRDMTAAHHSKDLSKLPFCPIWKYGTVEYDKEKKEYFKKVRCPFAETCKCGQAKLDEEVAYKNSHRRPRKSKVFTPRTRKELPQGSGLREEDKETT